MIAVEARSAARVAFRDGGLVLASVTSSGEVGSGGRGCQSREGWCVCSCRSVRRITTETRRSRRRKERRARDATRSKSSFLAFPAKALRHAHYSQPLLLSPSPLEGEGARGQRPRAGGGCKRRASTIESRGARIPWCGACGTTRPTALRSAPAGSVAERPNGLSPPVSARDERFALARALPTSPSRGEGQKCVHALARKRGTRATDVRLFLGPRFRGGGGDDFTTRVSPYSAALARSPGALNAASKLASRAFTLARLRSLMWP